MDPQPDNHQQDYDTARGTYTSDYDIKIDFMMPEISASKIINQRFHIDKEEDEMNIRSLGETL